MNNGIGSFFHTVLTEIEMYNIIFLKRDKEFLVTGEAIY